MAGQSPVIEPIINKDPFTGDITLRMRIASCSSYPSKRIDQFCVTSDRNYPDAVLCIDPFALKNKSGFIGGGLFISCDKFYDSLRLSILFEDDSVFVKDLMPQKTGMFIWELSESDCELLLFKKIKIIRGQDDDRIIDFPFVGDSLVFKELDDLLPVLIERFLEEAAKEVGWAPSSEEIKTEHEEISTDSDDFENQADYCYVYLMNDTANGFHKIGMSNDPEYRESTLQSEKPTIVKVCHKMYPSRKIAHAIESALHKVYESKRIRGEWFSLTEKDIWEIKQTLS